ncbi:MAG: hypothetical protein COW19_11490 [Zetaproteobacteria bacterium CG12_big_fil_rev_8_21_14_0_65_55_1124]|nr:MAG: hypothetical protein AUJ58_02340 [Zetaproteobacteria bacterium CG1_02_55_237]PIS19058.1 MAG: hypothetical protein COT53_07730 [Zetaproteobacteria bacterium CG08_land_8_20_14_0_20_55_17]PIW41838.1 MAG: hypothetical protein COW19_11490 [Zetaproteobacteria bacterium CG12_big_fil_rev_8_21_14_0_65_55_1124]PIY54075.1 MAG: hypothetical protein COZ01_01740 [Zetaproteobacteria bacterium CG_4_10_14_0_8_um_filter_55_43]PIZ40250.1 MAG: hypothetical protein COY36_00270 [Zetaproteobacteria bacterium 
MKRSVWMLGLLVLMSGCMSTQHYDEIMGSVSDVNALKNSDRSQDQRIRELENVVKDLQSSLKSEISTQGVKVSSASDEGVRVTLPEAVLFSSGSVQINAQGRKVLSNVALVVLKGADNSIRIVGHSDALPVSGELKTRFADNWELSAARAAAVARVFVWGAGIEANRIRVEGRGAADPVADNTSEKGRDQNRRIEIFIAS